MKPNAAVLSVALALALLGAFVPSAFAQEPQGKLPRIGLLISETLSGQASRIAALRGGLRDLGYAEGKTIVIEVRSADGKYDRLPELAAELTRLNIDGLVAFGSKATMAASQATTTIPIVVPIIGDPVALGLADSFARPQRNITGISSFGLDLPLKRMEFLKEAAPHIKRVAWLMNPVNATGQLLIQSMSTTAKSLKLELQRVEVAEAKALGTIFSAMAKGHIDAINLSTDTFFQANAREIANLAVKQRLPSVGAKEFAEVGGLIGYGVNDAEQFRRGASVVDRILKGAKVGDLPIERPTRFELAVNMKTAKAIRLTIPPAISIRADEVIQ